jgi:two-component system response regulator YesN
MVKLLIADDEHTIRKGLSGYMPWHEIGCEVTDTAGDGAEAVKLIDKNLPDIVITDIRMPNASGIDIARYVYERHPGMKVIILTGYADFEYARQAMRYGVADYILKPVSKDTLMGSVKKCVRQLKRAEDNAGLLHSQFFEELARSENKEKHIASAAELGVSLDAFCAAAFQSKTTADGTAGLDFITNSIHERWPEDYTYYRKGFMCWIHKERDEPGESAAFKDACTEMTLIGRNLYALELSAGLSRGHSGLNSVAAAEAEAEEALRQGYYTGRVVSAFDAEATPKSQPDADRAEELLALEQSLGNHEFDKTRRAVQKIFAQMKKAVNPVPDIKAAGIQIYYIFRSYLIKNGISLDNANIIPALNRAENAEQIQKELLGLYERLVREAAVRFSRYNPTVEKAIRFIRANYKDNLSLEVIAEHIPVNPSHLSRTFKREYGEPLTEYINKVRIEKAGELLSTTNMLAYEVAEAVGFNDPTYFSMVFKKHTGVSPKEYKLEKKR